MTSTHAVTTSTAMSSPTDLNRRWADAFNARDLPAMMAMYEPDAVLVPGPGAEPVHGHPAIAAALEWFLGLGGTLRFTTRYWLVRGDLALGSIEFVMDGGHDEHGQPVDLRGATTELARRQIDGTWKYVIDHPFGAST